MRGARAAATATATLAMTGLLAALAWTGKTPGTQMLQRFEPGGGIVAVDPPGILKVDMRIGGERIGLHRISAGGWAFDGPPAQSTSADVASHLETALRFMHASAPTRMFERGDEGTSIAEFGLEPPAFVVLLAAVDKTVITADFGALNPAQTSQYVRLAGGPTVYLVPRHVGNEWRLTMDLAKRGLPAGRNLAQPLLPASIDQCWAIEIVFAGKLHRFERDQADRWFLHVGQHSHDATTPAHVADPIKAPIIDAAFTAFGETTIDSVAARHPSRRERSQFGLDRPMLVALLYPRDSSTPIARVEIGGIATEGYGRYAQLSQDGDVVTIAPDEPQRLIDLLRDVGAS